MSAAPGDHGPIIWQSESGAIVLERDRDGRGIWIRERDTDKGLLGELLSIDEIREIKSALIRATEARQTPAPATGAEIARYYVRLSAHCGFCGKELQQPIVNAAWSLEISETHLFVHRLCDCEASRAISRPNVVGRQNIQFSAAIAWDRPTSDLPPLEQIAPQDSERAIPRDRDDEEHGPHFQELRRDD